jgi:hypothetical protein
MRLQGFELADKRYYNFITGVSPDAFRENHTSDYGFPLAIFNYSPYLCTIKKLIAAPSSLFN